MRYPFGTFGTSYYRAFQNFILILVSIFGISTDAEPKLFSFPPRIDVPKARLQAPTKVGLPFWRNVYHVFLC